MKRKPLKHNSLSSRTGFCAFSHKSGIHAKAILNNPSTYEILDPSDFGLTRYVHFASRITGWNAVKSRVEQLGLTMTDTQVKEVTSKIKALADIRPIAIDDADSIIRSFHLDIQKQIGEVQDGDAAKQLANGDAKVASEVPVVEPENPLIEGQQQQQTGQSEGRQYANGDQIAGQLVDAVNAQGEQQPSTVQA